MWELVALVRDWFDGANVSDDLLWGQEVRYWARWGKGLQFLAGLVVIFDLLSPARMRAQGSAARRKLVMRIARQRRRKVANRVEDLRKALDRCLNFVGIPDDKEQWVAEPVANLTTGIPEPELREWVRGTRAGMNPHNWRTVPAPTTSPYSTATYVRIDEHDRDFVDRREREFLRVQLSPFEFAAWNTLGRTVRRYRFRAGSVWFAAALAMSVIPWLLGLGPGPTEAAPWWVILSSSVLMMIGAFVILGTGDLLTVWLLRLPQVAFYTAIASILDSARPGHKLRWAAFVLFIFGFFFDMLAS